MCYGDVRQVAYDHLHSVKSVSCALIRSLHAVSSLRSGV